MRSTSKVILFSRVTVGNKVHQWPVAVFTNVTEAKTYAVLISGAHKNADAALAVKLDSQTRLNEDGTLVPGIKFSLTEAPYAPTLADSADELFGPDKAAAL